MNVSEQLPHIILVSALKAKIWIMAEVDFLFPYLYAHCHCNVFKAFYKALPDVFEIVITENQINPAVESIKDFTPLNCTSEAKVSKVKYRIVFTDNTIPVVYHRLVHLISAFERTLTILDDIGMIEMGVRCEEHLITIKFIVHCLLFLLWHPGGSWWLLKRLLLLSPLLIVVEKVIPVWTQKKQLS